MKRRWFTFALAATAAAGIARAEITAEAIPQNTLKEIAPLAVQMIAEKLPQPPLKVDPDAGKVVGYHVGEALAVVAMPDRNLTAKLIQDVGEKDLPAAIIATKSLGPVTRDVTVAADKVAFVDFNGTIKIPVFYVAVKGKGDERSLALYSKDGTAVGTAPLKKVTGDAGAPIGLKLTNFNEEKKQLDLVVTLNGAYEGTLRMGFLDL
jgi:hypothetical protein